MHRLSDGRLLRSVALPAALQCVALEPGEHAAFAGGADGAVYEVPLLAVGSRVQGCRVKVGLEWVRVWGVSEDGAVYEVRCLRWVLGGGGGCQERGGV